MPSHGSRRISRRVAAQYNTNARGAHLCEITNLQVPRSACVRNLIRTSVGELIFKPLDFARRNRLVQKWIIEPCGAARLHPAAADTEIWCHEYSGMLPQQLEEFFVHFFVANQMSEAFDARAQQALRIVQIEHVRDDAQVVFVSLIDGCSVQFRGQFFLRTVAVVHPDFYEVGSMRSQITYRLSGLFDRRYDIRNVISCGIIWS